VIEYEIIEADTEVTRKIIDISKKGPRYFDLVAALQFQLARDPVSYSSRVPGLYSQVYATWTTNVDLPGAPRLLFWYVLDGRKITIHDAWLIEEPGE